MRLEFETAFDAFVRLGSRITSDMEAPSTREFYDLMSRELPQPFSFLEIKDSNWETEPSNLEEPLSLPFKYCAFSFDDMRRLPILEVSDPARKGMRQLAVHALFVYEFGPYRYGIYTFGELCKIQCGHQNLKCPHHEVFCALSICENEIFFKNDKTFRNMRGLIENVCLRAFDREAEVGSENFRRRVPLRTENNKITQKKLSKVIYIRPRAANHLNQTHDSQHVHLQWSHSWLVRGHWRKIEGLGKDRDGNYRVVHFTWVKDHRKGNSDLPVVQKIRVIEDD